MPPSSSKIIQSSISDREFKMKESQHWERKNILTKYNAGVYYLWMNSINFRIFHPVKVIYSSGCVMKEKNWIIALFGLFRWKFFLLLSASLHTWCKTETHWFIGRDFPNLKIVWKTCQWEKCVSTLFCCD